MKEDLHSTQNDTQQGISVSPVTAVIKPRPADLGSFSVRRALPSHPQRKVGPWVFFDHAGPAIFKPGEGVDVRPHPHINLATVTYMFEGQFMHRDSIGSVQLIRPGDINLMVAGRGIVHSERTPADVRAAGHTLHALQLWLALPEADEEIAPAFYHYDASELPAIDVDGVQVRVMMGSAFGFKSPVKTYAQTLYIEAYLKKGQHLQLPAADERAVYMAKGSVSVGGTVIEEYSMAVLDAAAQVTLQANEDCRLALIGGENPGERFVQWNFVSSRKSRIAKAKQDWQDGRFDKIPGDAKEFIPFP